MIFKYEDLYVLLKNNIYLFIDFISDLTNTIL